VLPEESTHQSVTALMVNTLTKPTFAEIATLNVKLALTMPFVLNVLKTLTELTLILVSVSTDTMKMEPLSVQLVTKDAEHVSNMTNVSNVLNQESTQTDVIAQIICSITWEPVWIVPINVTDVKEVQKSVKNVHSVELKPQSVTVSQDSMTMVSLPNVQNVNVTVLLVITLDVRLVLVSDMVLQIVDVKTELITL